MINGIIIYLGIGAIVYFIVTGIVYSVSKFILGENNLTIPMAIETHGGTNIVIAIIFWPFLIFYLMLLATLICIEIISKALKQPAE